MSLEESAAIDPGLDPDVRFLLANERTLLAWVRTALAVIAGGIVLAQLGNMTAMKTFLGVATILMGATTAVVGYVRYQAADKAIRTHKLPDKGHGPAFQVAGVSLFAAVVATIMIARLH